MVQAQRFRISRLLRVGFSVGPSLIVGRCDWLAASDSKSFAPACGGWQETRQVIDLLACRKARVVDPDMRLIANAR